MGGVTMATQEKLTKSTIRMTLKDLQGRKRYKTLEEVRLDLQRELEEEGYTLDPADQERVRLIVDDEGYTGRFAIDDIIMKKLKNKKYWPVISVVIAVLCFVVAEAVGGVIQYFVQKPFADSQIPVAAPAAIAAFFQLPERVDGTMLRFKVTVQNQLKNEALKDLVLFASVDDVVTKISIAQLPPEGKQSIVGNLDIKNVHKDKFNFNAYIIGARVSFKSEPIEIVKKAGVVAMKPQPAAHDIAMISSAKDESARQVAMAGRSNMESGGAKLKAQSMPPSAPLKTEKESMSEGSPVTEGKKSQISFDVKGGNKDIAMKATKSDTISDVFIAKLAGLDPKAMKSDDSYMVLQTLAASGNEKAKRFIDEHSR
jgi:hypothetical protein